MYKLSNKSRDEFLKNKYLTFLIHCFITSELGINFIKEQLIHEGRDKGQMSQLKYEEIFGSDIKKG
jgi:hypothetical protein